MKGDAVKKSNTITKKIIADLRTKAELAARHRQERAIFIRKLAHYLVDDQAKKSIQLQMGSKEAHCWADLRDAAPLFGYPTVEEAEKILTEFLK
jgi:hypothetical protein